MSLSHEKHLFLKLKGSKINDFVAVSGCIELESALSKFEQLYRDATHFIQVPFLNTLVSKTT